MKKLVIWFILLYSLLLFCHPSPSPTVQKIDGRLMQKLDASSDTQNFTGQCSRDINSHVRAELERTGIEIVSIIGTVFTAKGNREAILKCAKIPDVVRIQHPKKHHLLEK